MVFKELCKELEAKIVESYERGVTLEEAEKLASEFLGALIKLSSELKKAGLDSRMRKRGFKAIKSAIRKEEIKKHDKKPTEGQLEDLVNTDELCLNEEKAMDESLENKEELQRYYDIFREAHIHYRGISRGKFE